MFAQERCPETAMSEQTCLRPDWPLPSPFVFPGDVPGQPVIALKRVRTRMRENAEIPDVLIHDRRHTFASLLVSGVASLEMIGRLLGHAQIGTTQRYALLDSPLRAGVNAVGEMLKPRLKVLGGHGMREKLFPLCIASPI